MATQLETLLPLIARIQANNAADNSLAALAEQAGLSPGHLQRIFARMVGESPKHIASRIALERAAAALITTQRSILDIALDSGFDSHEGFTRAFRRHFDTSPARYRARGIQGLADISPELAATHRDVTETAGPCIGLFGTRIDEPVHRKPAMTYTITKKTVEETPFLFMRRRIEHAKIGDTLGELLPGVFQYISQKGLAFAGPPTCRYCDWSATHVTLEAGLPVAGPDSGDGDIIAGTLPAGPAATTIHIGPYDLLSKAHGAVETWMAENKLKSAGDPYEIYLTDPGQVPDPAEWQTEIVWPTNE